MRIEGTYASQGPRDRIFALLVDEEVLRRCVPGCRRLTKEGEDRFSVALDVGLGSVTGSYEGTVSLSEKVPPERLQIDIEGKGKLGFVRGKASLRLAAAAQNGAPSTLIAYQGEVQIGGTIASVGQRVLQGTAKMMAGQFFAAVEAEAVAAETASVTPVRHGPWQNFFRWLRSILRSMFRRPTRTA
ncbi:MAG TPA: carbon monoxide dehydrogenase subunit G [Myxococcaceae bacterium]|nr:carbon monoxide dehydrogenase subunit G [Myxococcaceae bacterium]